jgi:hypothetical protein
MWPFKNKEKQPELPILPFKTEQGFFDYWCKYGDNRLEVDRPILAMVLDSREIAGTIDAVKTSPEGYQSAMIRVASDDGGFEAFAQTSGQGEPLEPGDLVMWLPGQYMAKLGATCADPRTGWIGLIIAKVAAELDPNTNQFRPICVYRDSARP